jgi:hypothetical protein
VGFLVIKNVRLNFKNKALTIITELHYLPCVQYLKQLESADCIYLEAHENYQKSSYRNRCHILGSDGQMRLSIPLLQGKNQKQPIRDVRIENTILWQRQHFHALRSAYGSAPFWEHYADYFEAIFKKKQPFLWDWNIEILALLTKLLKINTPIVWTTAYESQQAQLADSDLLSSDIVDCRNLILPKNQVEMPSYPQVFTYKHEFVSNLSAIDALMNMGRL